MDRSPTKQRAEAAIARRLTRHAYAFAAVLKLGICSTTVVWQAF